MPQCPLRHGPFAAFSGAECAAVFSEGLALGLGHGMAPCHTALPSFPFTHQNHYKRDISAKIVREDGQICLSSTPPSNYSASGVCEGSPWFKASRLQNSNMTQVQPWPTPWLESRQHGPRPASKGQESRDVPQFCQLLGGLCPFFPTPNTHFF